MNFFRKLILMGCILCSCLSFSKDKDAIYRIFWNPYIHGQRLAYCDLNHKHCGSVVANAYCKEMGYVSSDRMMKENNAGLTYYLDAPVRCKGWSCDSFKMIKCVGKIEHTPPNKWHYQYQKFVYPRFDNYRVDWCYNGEAGCGQKAANSFCRRMGFASVKNFKRQDNLAATRAIGNEKLCFQTNCSGFSVINCSR